MASTCRLQTMKVEQHLQMQEVTRGIPAILDKNIFFQFYLKSYGVSRLALYCAWLASGSHFFAQSLNPYMDYEARYFVKSIALLQKNSMQSCLLVKILLYIKIMKAHICFMTIIIFLVADVYGEQNIFLTLLSL